MNHNIPFRSHSRRIFCLHSRFLQTPRTPHPGLLVAGRALHLDSPPIIPTLTTSYARGTSSTSLLHDTVGQCLQRTVEPCPDREAMVFVEEGIRMTFAQFQHDVDRVASGLLALGLTKGDRLGLWAPNIYKWILFLFATAKAGIILVSVNPAYNKQEVEFLVRKVGCKAIVCPTQFKTQRYCDMLRQLCPEIGSSSLGDIRSKRFPDLRLVIVLDSRQPGMFNMEDVCQAGSSQFVQQLQDLQRKLSSNEPINIHFTSGTTGHSKAATLSHSNIVNNSYFFGRRLGYHWKPDYRICMPLPLFHCFGSIVRGLGMAVHGVCLVFPSAGYDVKKSMAAIESERCTMIYGNATTFLDMISHPDFAKYDFSSVEAGLSGGSAFPVSLFKEVISATGIKELITGYGTTENSPITFLGCPKDNLERKSETVGFVLDHTEAKIVNPSTNALMPLGESGEVMIRGYRVMLGYWEDEAKTKECITRNGWYKTGDIGRMDAYGYLQIVGRIKDMIIRGGVNIYPAEIENFLHQHPKINDAQVIGINDLRLGEEICACIILVDGLECTAEEIKAYCKGMLAVFKIPRYIRFVTSFPLTETRKVKKAELRKEIEKEMGMNGGN